MESVAVWQTVGLCGLLSWIGLASYINLTQKLRSLLRPWVARHVIAGAPLVLRIQRYQNSFFDAMFSGLSCIVSVSFYTAFLPLLFWSGHGKLARQMTLLMAFCDYLGNSIKDVVSAPRPSCPPVRRITATKGEEENAMEYGLPSSHTLNTVCLSGYLLYYILSYTEDIHASYQFTGFALVCLLVGLIGLGRIYLGMHSPIDIIFGLVFGLMILLFWLNVHEYVDSFITSGQNVTYFWGALSILLLFAYPTPEFPTPSYEFHTAFDGVAFGIVSNIFFQSAVTMTQLMNVMCFIGIILNDYTIKSSLFFRCLVKSFKYMRDSVLQISGVQQTYHQFHHEAVARIFTPQLPFATFVGRMLVGLPTILTVKFCSKALAKWILPIVSNTLGMPITSTSYIPMLKSSSIGKVDGSKQRGPLHKLFFFSSQDSFDVDTGIRFVQYAGLAWSVVDLVPSLFSYLNL